MVWRLEFYCPARAHHEFDFDFEIDFCISEVVNGRSGILFRLCN